MGILEKLKIKFFVSHKCQALRLQLQENFALSIVATKHLHRS
jgi:hypothetical protein